MGKRKSRSVVRLGKNLLSAGHSALDLPVSKMEKNNFTANNVLYVG
jgi:hypothetical protein